MISPIVALLMVYAATTLAVILVTLLEYVRARQLTLTTLLYALREVVTVAIEFIWWVVILRAWGFLEIEYAAQADLSLDADSGQLTYLALLTVSMLIAALYWEGYTWLAALASLGSALVFHHLIDVSLLSLMVAIGVALSGTAFWAVHSEVREREAGAPKPPRSKQRRKKEEEVLAVAG